MEFRFFALDDNAKLREIGQFEAVGSFDKLQIKVEQHFDDFLSTKEPRQMIVLCTDMGEPPGKIVAVEAVYVAHSSGRVKAEQQVRTLVWFVEENVPKHR